jgi:hypothetical protein
VLANVTFYIDEKKKKKKLFFCFIEKVTKGADKKKQPKIKKKRGKTNLNFVFIFY